MVTCLNCYSFKKQHGEGAKCAVCAVREASEDTQHAMLAWCENHKEPAWFFEDGSWCCQWQIIVETNDESECSIVDNIPKEFLFDT